MNKKDMMEELRERYKDCDKCPALCENREKVSLGQGALNAKIVFVGQSPSNEGDLMTADSRDLLLKLIKGAGILEDDIYVTNIVACPTPRASPLSREVKNCFDRLSEEIEIVDPYIVVTLGPDAAKALTKVKTRFASFAKHPESPFTFAVTKGRSVEAVKRPGIVTFSPQDLIDKGKVEFTKDSDLHWLFLAVSRAKELKNTYTQLLGEEK